MGSPFRRGPQVKVRSGRICEPDMRLYETHIPVADTRIAESFYEAVVGLFPAYRDPKRDVAFL